jgi:hypothetical protein
MSDDLFELEDFRIHEKDLPQVTAKEPTPTMTDAEIEQRLGDWLEDDHDRRHLRIYADNSEIFWAGVYIDGQRAHAASGYGLLETIAAALEGMTIQERPRCMLCQDGKGPSHDGSKLCRSGSIASGGTRPHCSCDICF